jgi:hypothetical protein
MAATLAQNPARGRGCRGGRPGESRRAQPHSVTSSTLRSATMRPTGNTPRHDGQGNLLTLTAEIRR